MKAQSPIWQKSAMLFVYLMPPQHTAIEAVISLCRGLLCNLPLCTTLCAVIIGFSIHHSQATDTMMHSTGMSIVLWNLCSRSADNWRTYAPVKWLHSMSLISGI